MFVTPGVVVDGKLVTTDLVEINLGIRILLGQLVLRRLGRPGDVRQHTTRWATRSTGGTRGTSTPTRKPQKRDFDDKYSWVMSPRWFDGTDHLALRHRRRPARPAVVDGAGRPGRHRLRQGDRPQRADQPAEDRAQGPGRVRVEDPAVRQQHDRAQPRPHLLPGLRGGVRAALRREGAGRDPRRPHQDLGEVQGARRGHRLRLHRGGARRALAPHGDPRRQDRELPPVPADAVERQPARQLRHARARTRTRCRTRRSSRRTAGRTSRASTSCARCAASTRACRAACTCTSATGKTLEKLHSPTQSVTGE